MRTDLVTIVLAIAGVGVTFAAEPAVPVLRASTLSEEEAGDGSIVIDGELKQWHPVTLTLDGPFARESDQQPNPFTDYRMEVQFRHESGSPSYRVPGYFAADGRAAETSAFAGTKWRAHLSPDKAGTWTYSVRFQQGKLVALDPTKQGTPLPNYHRKSGSLVIAPTDKAGRDFRGQGRLQYVGKHHLRFAQSGQFFLKAGPDAPETLLAYQDFDGTVALKENVPLKTWQPHVQDWREGNPTWKRGQGKGLIGALNYLASKGCNTFSFLPYNVGGDGQNVWPMIAPDDQLHYDCSKLDQWQIVFAHAQTLGLHLHFKMQEQENDDNRRGAKRDTAAVPAALDGGDLGPARMLYCRELIARFSHNLALNWNLGEENTQSSEQQRAMAQYIQDMDPYDHNIVVHTFPNAQDKVYPPLLGKQSVLTGASLQNEWRVAHQRTLKWVRESARAGRPWVVANDEQGPANLGVPPDPGFEGFDGQAGKGDNKYDLHDIRKYTLWGNLMGGGAGVEYYFGYQLPQNDLLCQDFRSRDRTWDFCRIALDFFREHAVPFWEMTNANSLIDNPKNTNARYCLAKKGEVYLVYLPEGGSAELDLTGQTGRFRADWFNPRNGDYHRSEDAPPLSAGRKVNLGDPPDEQNEDWLVVIRRARG
jgi:hypothetical protein